ncbi:sugar phosphate isomerase/epimerase family protein [Radiobacillus sp. PE A8.2]|uniref:sugar phosphate isomerase/epimerase family protein n=1 Tax=Radiobacillus sp. PE A8.2 TaxID=3380349 RepID=UPI00388CF8B5
MYKLGLCSVTFRKLTVDQIIRLASEANLEGIEWGSDVHVPVDALEHAKQVAKLTKIANLEIVSYGSYYRVGEENESNFEEILQTAVNLEAPAIRVWAGARGSADATRDYREQVISDARKIGSMAEKQGVSIHFEYHGDTLTDTMESAKLLMQSVDHSNVYIYWQPSINTSAKERLASIRAIQPWLSNIHVFHWSGTERLPLEEGKVEWASYLSEISKSSINRYLLMEFVKEDSAGQFLKDAKVLKNVMETT